jgi:hypothetical protein
MEAYYLRAIDRDGRESFYNGKAGPSWTSPNRNESFLYQTKEAAQRKAVMFNRMTEIHGLRFIALLY